MGGGGVSDPSRTLCLRLTAYYIDNFETIEPTQSNIVELAVSGMAHRV